MNGEICKKMLGGSVYIALIRFTISLAGVILFFSLMSESKYGRKKTIICYGCFGTFLIAAACIWYAIDWQSCARMVAYMLYGVFRLYEPGSALSVNL